MTPRVSIVVPVYNEGAEILTFLDRVFEAVTLPCELIAVYDRPDDTTVPHLEALAATEARLRPLLNRFGRGPAAALRYGIDQAQSEVVVVTMADGSDDPHQIDQLTRLVERGVAVAAASRYMRGGQQVGGPWLKGMISRTAGVSLSLLGRVGTHDPTNSFKAYSRQFIQEVGINSDAGFTLGIELVAKAKQRGLPVAEIPTIWLDRAEGTSNFRLSRWLGHYLHWYLQALRPNSPAAQAARDQTFTAVRGLLGRPDASFGPARASCGLMRVSGRQGWVTPAATSSAGMILLAAPESEITYVPVTLGARVPCQRAKATARRLSEPGSQPAT